MRFIHAADLHLDSPLRGLDRYQGAPVERLRNATRAALERLVDLAITENVDFLLLAGDIYDRDWQDFNTGLFFRGQMARLGRAGIRVFAIQGNHDAQGVITRQLKLPDNVTLFSSRAAETVCIEEFSVALHGRSFPARAVDEDLVPGYPAPLPGLFNIGLLHTSLNGRKGHDPYAPTDAEVLAAKGYDYWALGHVHAREVIAEQAPRILFPGNLQGRHANETGPKGCELVDVETGRSSSRFVPLDVVRWNRLDLSLQGVDRLDGLDDILHAAVQPLLADAGDRLHALRVRLEGSSALHGLEAERPGTLDAAVRAAVQDLGDAEIWIEQVRSDLGSPLDRERAGQRRDAIGELIRLVDAIGADEAGLGAFAARELGELLGNLPPEVETAEALRLEDADGLRVLLREAEATVLARLALSGDDAP